MVAGSGPLRYNSLFYGSPSLPLKKPCHSGRVHQNCSLNPPVENKDRHAHCRCSDAEPQQKKKEKKKTPGTYRQTLAENASSWRHSSHLKAIVCGIYAGLFSCEERVLCK